MIQLHRQADSNFRLWDASANLALIFHCAARIGLAEAASPGMFSAWLPIGSDVWESRHEPSGVVQRLAIRTTNATSSVQIHHSFINRGPADAGVHSIVTVSGRIEFKQPPPLVGYLHALNPRFGLNPLARLEANVPSPLLGRVTYLFFEGLVVEQGEGKPFFVIGPLTQNLVHRSQQLTWDGDRSVSLAAEQDLRGIDSKIVPAGATLVLDGIFAQFGRAFDPNTAFADYLFAVGKANGTRWAVNPLRRSHFHAPWNNYLYWQATEEEILRTAEAVKVYFPETVQGMGVDDGYQKAWVHPELSRTSGGELKYDNQTELVWYKNCPGISFGFSEGLGEDKVKFPSGLYALSAKIRSLGLRPMLWLGMEISMNHPLYARHPDWFLEVIKESSQHALLDISVPEVRAQIERVFANYYGAKGWHALKLDFWSQLFERPDLRFKRGNLTAAEWRRWFFEMIRRHLPEDGFINLGCDLAMGAAWVAPWVDSYRFSMDMRDGDWENVKSNVRWSMVPALAHGFQQPIGDCDSVSVFKGLTASERTCWADYSHQIGSVVEIGGDPARWTEADKAWLRHYLNEPRGGQHFWFGDSEAWSRDGLPRIVCRERQSPAETPDFIVSLHNWGDQPMQLAFADWNCPARGGIRYRDLRTEETGDLHLELSFSLPARTSRLLEVK